MPLIAASTFFLGLQRQFQLGLLFHNKTKIIMGILLVASALNLALNLIFVPHWGFIAAAWSTLIGYAVFCFSSLLHPESTLSGISHTSQ